MALQRRGPWPSPPQDQMPPLGPHPHPQHPEGLLLLLLLLLLLMELLLLLLLLELLELEPPVAPAPCLPMGPLQPRRPPSARHVPPLLRPLRQPCQVRAGQAGAAAWWGRALGRMHDACSRSQAQVAAACGSRACACGQGYA